MNFFSEIGLKLLEIRSSTKFGFRLEIRFVIEFGLRLLLDFFFLDFNALAITTIEIENEI